MKKKKKKKKKKKPDITLATLQHMNSQVLKNKYVNASGIIATLHELPSVLEIYYIASNITIIMDTCRPRLGPSTGTK